MDEHNAIATTCNGTGLDSKLNLQTFSFCWCHELTVFSKCGHFLVIFSCFTKIQTGKAATMDSRFGGNLLHFNER